MVLPVDIELPAIFQTISANPEALEAVKQLNETICFGNSAISRAQEEAIATVVSVANQCRYGALTHGGFFRRQTGDPELASHLLGDYLLADLDPRNRQMLDFAIRLTREPGSFNAQDLEGLRQAGFDQEAIVSIILITCLSNFMNRLAIGFGVEVPPGYRKVVESWLSGPAAQESWLLPRDEFQPDDSPADRMGLEVPGGRQNQRDTVQIPSGGLRSDTKRGPLSGEQKGAGDSIPSTDQLEAMHVPSREGQEDDARDTSLGGQRDAETDDSQAEQESAGELERPDSQETMPSLEHFISQCCTVATLESTTARDLYISYLRWSDDHGEPALLQRNFGMQLTQLGYRRSRRSGGRHWWQGIGLKEQGK